MFSVVCDEKVTRCLTLCVMDCHTWSEMLCFCDGLSQGRLNKGNTEITSIFFSDDPGLV